MNIPDKLNVGGHVYKVLKGYKFKEDRTLWGQVDHAVLEIRLTDAGDTEVSLAQSKKEEVFLHEILHCICGITGVKLDEGDVHRVSESLYQVLKTNNMMKETE